MSDQDAFERIVGLLNEAMLDDTRWPEASALLDEAFGARGSALVFGDERAEDNSRFFFTKCCFRGTDRSAWLGTYLSDYAPEDEQLPRMRALPDAKIVPLADLYSDEERRKSRAFNEFWSHHHGRHGLAVRLDGPGGAPIWWGISDPVDADGWSSSRLDMIGRVVPHVRQYVRMRSALVDAGALGTSVIGLLDHARAGVVQLDWGGRIVEANDRAREVLRRNDGLSAENGRLRATSPAVNDRLQPLLARALPRFGEQGASGSMLVRRPSLRPSLVLHVTPVQEREGAGRSREVAALVLIVDPADRARVDPGLVQGVLGLTPVQSEIAVLLAEGRTAPQIAAATGRGYGTVRTHLRHMYAKLGVSHQVEVVQLVLALASLPASRE